MGACVKVQGHITTIYVRDYQMITTVRAFYWWWWQERRTAVERHHVTMTVRRYCADSSELSVRTLSDTAFTPQHVHYRRRECGSKRSYPKVARFT